MDKNTPLKAACKRLQAAFLCIGCIVFFDKSQHNRLVTDTEVGRDSPQVLLTHVWLLLLVMASPAHAQIE